MKPRRIAALAAGLSLAAVTSGLGAEQSITLGGVDTTVWSRERANGNPVVVFSHGFHGCATQSRFLMEALAAAGYLVLAPNHRDATCNGGAGRWRDQPQSPFRSPNTWDPSIYRDRAEDVRRVIEAARADARFASADWSRLGLAGHSLGGYTVLGLAGAWPGWKLDGVKAVLALSPYSQPFIVHHTLAGLGVPVMYQGGTRDFGVTPAIAKSFGAYEQSPRPKYFVEFEGAGHLAWTDVGRRAHEAIVAYGVAFMDRYLEDPRRRCFSSVRLVWHDCATRTRSASNPASVATDVLPGRFHRGCVPMLEPRS